VVRLIRRLLVLACVWSLPRWLPNRIVALRGKVFARINGEEGICGRRTPARIA